MDHNVDLKVEKKDISTSDSDSDSSFDIMDNKEAATTNSTNKRNKESKKSNIAIIPPYVYYRPTNDRTIEQPAGYEGGTITTIVTTHQHRNQSNKLTRVSGNTFRNVHGDNYSERDCCSCTIL